MASRIAQVKARLDSSSHHTSDDPAIAGARASPEGTTTIGHEARWTQRWLTEAEQDPREAATPHEPTTNGAACSLASSNASTVFRATRWGLTSVVLS